MNRVLKILFWVSIGIYIPVVLSFISIRSNELVCSDMRVVVLDSASSNFVSAAGIKRYIITKHGSFKGKAIEKIDTEKLELTILKYPAIKSCEVYFSLNGVLCVGVSQRKAVVRVFEKGSSYYLDKKGNRIPDVGAHVEDMLVFTGFISRLDSLDALLEVNHIIRNDSFWDSQIEQVNVEADGDFILIPRVGNHKIILGKPTDVEKKLDKLMALYSKGLKPLEWNSFNVINLKYKGQVICSKP